MRHSTASVAVIGRHRRGNEPGCHRAPVSPSKRGHGAAVLAAALTGAMLAFGIQFRGSALVYTLVVVLLILSSLGLGFLALAIRFL